MPCGSWNFRSRTPLRRDGAGSAAAPSACARRDGPEALRILNETPGPVEALASKLRVSSPVSNISASTKIRRCGLRATDTMPMDPSRLPANCAVCDIIAARRTRVHDGLRRRAASRWSMASP